MDALIEAGIWSKRSNVRRSSGLNWRAEPLVSAAANHVSRILLAVAWLMLPLATAVVATQIDTANTRLSQAGHFNVSFVSRTKPISINQMHEWVVHVATPGGDPVDNAAITISGGMPEHSHGLPTEPQMTQDLGNGDYLVEGFKFQMPGHWQVTFGITAGDKVDSVTFDLAL